MHQWAVLDLETTGGSPGPDRITEIGLVLIDGCEEIKRYQTLVDPGRSIPPFVRELTGITDDMVRGAPSFVQVGESLHDLLRDRILVAHNISFDYKFIKSELSLCGIAYDPPRLCTVQLGRKLFPGHASYSLAKISHDLGIESFRHHRALGDAQACAAILCKALSEHGADKVFALVKGGGEVMVLPKGWTRDDVLRIPAEPGVVRVSGLQGQLLFVGDARSMREKVIHLLSGGRRGPLWAVRQGIGSIIGEPTGNELLARLLANQAISQEKPICNKAVRIPPRLGAPLGNLVGIGPGRDHGERCLLLIQRGKLTGYRFADLSEGLDQHEILDGMISIAEAPDQTLFVQQQIQRGGGCWKWMPLARA